MGVVVVIDKQIVIAVEHLFDVTQAFMQGNVSKLDVLFRVSCSQTPFLNRHTLPADVTFTQSHNDIRPDDTSS